MRKALLVLALLAISAPARAQVSGPAYVFVNGTTANADEVNSDFSTIYANALNRTGGTMTGPLNTLNVLPTVTNASDLGSTSFFYRTAHVRTSIILGQTTANYTLTWSNPASARAISFEDPGGTDVLVYKAASQVLTNKTLTAPVLGGTVTGTYTLGGTPSMAASGITSGQLALARGGTNADLSATGGSNQVLKQSSSGAAVTVGPLASSNLSDAANIAYINVAQTFSASTGQNFTSTGADQHEFKSAQSQVIRIMDSSGNAPYLAGYDSTGVTRYGYLQFTATGVELNSNNTTVTLSGTATHVIGGGGTGSNSALQINGANASAQGPYISYAKNGSVKGYVGTVSGVTASGTSNDMALYAIAGGGIGLYANASLAFGINSSGDLTIGTSSHIFISSGTASAGFVGGSAGSIASGSTDSVWQLSSTGTGNTTVTVNFSHTFNNAPFCVVSALDGAGTPVYSVSTTAVTLTSPGNARAINGVCLGS